MATEGAAEAQKVALAVLAEVERKGGQVRVAFLYKEFHRRQGVFAP